MRRPGNIFITIAVISAAALSCSKESAESVRCSDIPVSFSAFGRWDESTKATTDGNVTAFSSGDRIGIFAYHNDSATPDFMNNQPAQYDGTSWNYSPIKYWPAAQDDRLSFYAYYPYSSDSHNCISIDGDGGAPTLTYSNPDSDIDLMAASAPGLTRTGNASPTVPLPFHHLLAKVRFKFTSETNTDYRPVVHMLKYDVPISSGIFSFMTNRWEEYATASEISRFTKNTSGYAVTEDGIYVDEFTAYLFPCSFPSKNGAAIGEFKVSLDNVIYKYVPKTVIAVEAGKCYTVNFTVKEDGTEGKYFIMSFSMWEEGDEEYTGELK